MGGGVALVFVCLLAVLAIPSDESDGPISQLTIAGQNILAAEGNTIQCGSGSATYDPSSNTLTLNNATIDASSSAYAIQFDGELNVKIVGKNVLNTQTNAYAVYGKVGEGEKFRLYGGTEPTDGSGPTDSITLTVNGTPFSITGPNGGKSYVEIENCVLDITASSSAPALYGQFSDVSITGSDLTVRESGQVLWAKNITISSTKLSAKTTNGCALYSNDQSHTGAIVVDQGSYLDLREASAGIESYGTVTIKGAGTTVIADTDYFGIIGEEGVTISEGAKVEATNHSEAALFSAGTVRITGEGTSVTAKSIGLAYDYDINEYYGPSAVVGDSVVIDGGAKLTASSEYGIGLYSWGTIEISGEGTEVSAESQCKEGYTAAAIWSDSTTTIKDGVIVVAECSSEVGLYSIGAMTISDSHVEARAKSAYGAMESYTGISITGSWVDAHDKIVKLGTATDSVVFQGTEGSLHGNTTMKSDATIRSGSTLTVGSPSEEAVLTIPDGVKLTNLGKLVNHGRVEGAANLDNQGDIECHNHYGGTASCGSPGVCALCATAYETVEHVFSDYVYNGDATCIEDGTETAVCQLCGSATDTRVAEGTALGHEYVNGVCVHCGSVTETRPPMIDLVEDEEEWYPTGTDDAEREDDAMVIACAAAAVVAALMAVFLIVDGRKR